MVFPTPCRPTIIIDTGGVACKSILVLSGPKTSTNSSKTIFIIICPGVTLFNTSPPTDCSLTTETNSLTTCKETSASNKATRISLRALSTSPSERTPFFPKRSKISENLELNASNTIKTLNKFYQVQKRQCAKLANWRHLC